MATHGGVHEGREAVLRGHRLRIPPPRGVHQQCAPALVRLIRIRVAAGHLRERTGQQGSATVRAAGQGSASVQECKSARVSSRAVQRCKSEQQGSHSES
eukprot:88095-Pyramimonas_sp.AAC.1